LVGRESLDELNTLRLKLSTHWWIHVGITASNTMSGLPSDCGNAAHESTANAQDMNMHWGILAKEWQ
jgi:hypothetical protein